VSTAWRAPEATSLVGRTVQMWNRYRHTVDFRDGKQWLLRFFDPDPLLSGQRRELAQMREDFPYGRFRLEVQDSTLRLRDYGHSCRRTPRRSRSSRRGKQAAFEAERERWNETASRETPGAAPDEAPALDGLDAAGLPEGCVAVSSPVAGSVWNMSVSLVALQQTEDTLGRMQAPHTRSSHWTS